MPAAVSPDRNALLNALPPAELAALKPKLTPVSLVAGDVVFSPGQQISSVWFPQSGMISLVRPLADGMQAEVGLIGREGVLGISLIAGVDTAYSEAVVQLPGKALKMSDRDFRAAIECLPVFRSILLRYNEALHAQVMQTAACNGRHALEERLARWLLMAFDRADTATLPLRQDFIAMMLGVHRPSVTIAAGLLQRAGMIKYSRGIVTMLDAEALAASSCECYAAVKQRFADLLGEAGQ